MEILSNPKHDYLEEKMEEKDTELGRGGVAGREKRRRRKRRKREFLQQSKEYRHGMRQDLV